MAASTQSSGGVRTQFKTPEGRYKLAGEKTHPIGSSHYSPLRAVTKVTIAHLRERPSSSTGSSSGSGSSSSSSGSSSGGGSFVSSLASSTTTRLSSRLLSGNGAGLFRSGGSNGIASKFTGGSRVLLGGGTPSSTPGSATNSTPGVSVDGEGTYLIFNVGDALFISDYNSQDKEPLKTLYFSNVHPGCHAFNPRVTDGHDLLIGLTTGDVYTASLRAQLQDPGKKLVGAAHYCRDPAVASNRCTAVSWVPNSEGLFISAHADGNIYVYDKDVPCSLSLIGIQDIIRSKWSLQLAPQNSSIHDQNKDGNGDSPFQAVKDPTVFTVARARSTKNNPIARWHICAGSVNGIAFSSDGHYLATVGRDGFLRIFDFHKETLVCGCKSYYGALLCCSWSKDSKYVLVGGEDDLVQVWSMEDRQVVAWGEGHSSWVSGVAFDPYWVSPSASNGEESMTYRIGSVGQDTQLFLWDFALDEMVVPLRSLVPLASSPNAAAGRGHLDASAHPYGVLQPPAVRKNVPRINLVMAHKVHQEPLSDVLFTKEAIITACQEGHVKVWQRPGIAPPEGVPGAGNAGHANGDIAGGTKIREVRDSERERRHLYGAN